MRLIHPSTSKLAALYVRSHFEVEDEPTQPINSHGKDAESCERHCGPEDGTSRIQQIGRRQNYQSSHNQRDVNVRPTNGLPQHPLDTLEFVSHSADIAFERQLSAGFLESEMIVRSIERHLPLRPIDRPAEGIPGASYLQGETARRPSAESHIGSGPDRRPRSMRWPLAVQRHVGEGRPYWRDQPCSRVCFWCGLTMAERVRHLGNEVSYFHGRSPEQPPAAFVALSPNRPHLTLT